MRPTAFPRSRGNVILIVLALMFAAITLMLAVFHVTSSTWMASMRTEADLESRQLARFRLFEELRGQALTPTSHLGLRAEQQEDDSLRGNLHASRLFRKDNENWNGLPDLRAAQKLSLSGAQQGYAGHHYFRYSFGRATSLSLSAVSAARNPYAVFTASENPRAVELDGIVGWKNPAFGSAATPETEYSSVAPVVLAPGGVQVKDMPAGKVLSATRPRLSATTPGAGAVAYVVPELKKTDFADNPQQFAQALRQQIHEARQQIVSAAAAVDKTLLFNDTMSASDSLGMFFTSLATPAKYKERLSLLQSQRFWIPTIPGFMRQFGVIYHVIFHIPDRPDGGLDTVAQAAQKALSELISAIRQMEKAIEYLEIAQKELQNARDWLDDHMDCGNCAYPWNWPCCGAREVAKGALYAAEYTLEVAKGAVDLAEQAVLVIVSPITDMFVAIQAASGQLPEPTDRRDEKDYKQRYGAALDSGGMDFWAYRSVFNGIGNIVKDLFAGRFDEVGRDFGHEQKLVFFGQMDKRQGWDFQGGITTRATMNVPANRSLSLNGNLSIQGDLWLGRGSTMVLNGSLRLAPGDTPLPRQGAPAAGRIYLEEGARLVVTGSITCAGDAAGGSVVQSGPWQGVHGITSAIFCGQDFVAPFGVVTGVPADEMPGVQTLMAPLMRSLGPNLAKIEGPFHRRHPYMARYTTTFEWLTAPIPMPFVIPESFPNMTVWVFRGLSSLYAPTLNFELGENFLTHCDWWGRGGEGRSPILTRPVARACAEELRRTGNWSTGLPANFVPPLDRRAGQIGKNAVEQYCDSLCIELAKQWTKAIYAKSGIPMLDIGTILSKILDTVNKHLYPIGTREAELDAVVPASQLNPLGSRMEAFWTVVDRYGQRPARELAQDCAGVLVYSGGRIQIGTPAVPAELANGWFVAESDLALHARLIVGAATSLSGGTIRGGRLLYYPQFTTLSLYINRPEPSPWLDRGKRSDYASDNDSRSEEQRSVRIGFPEQLLWLGTGKVR